MNFFFCGSQPVFYAGGWLPPTLDSLYVLSEALSLIWTRASTAGRVEGFYTHTQGCGGKRGMLLENSALSGGSIFFFFLATCVLFTADAISGLKTGCDWLGWLVFCCLLPSFPPRPIVFAPQQMQKYEGWRIKTGPVCVVGYGDAGAEIRLG